MYIYTHTHTHTNIYILTSYFCKTWALCVSWVTSNQFYIFGTGTFTPRHQFFIPDTSIIDIPVIIDITTISIMEVFGMKHWWPSVNVSVADMFMCITSLKTELLFLQTRLETSINTHILSVHATDPLIC